jgi:caa(3)-type oxidase subunit IV
MNSDTLLWVTLWAAAGSFVGGVLTPLFAERKRINEWLATLAGLILGGIGSLVALIPLWLVLRLLPDRPPAHPRWRADAVTLDELQAAARVERGTPGLLVALRANFWPRARAHGHSHRLTYVSVAIALAVITAVEVLLTVLDVPFPVTGPLVALSTSKVLLVALYFMHLRYDSRWYAAVFASSFPFAVLVITILALS